MPRKKKQETKPEEIPTKVDSIEEQQSVNAEEDKPTPIKWEELEKYIGQPLWDTREKKWRILDGYRRMQNTYSITFSDIADWVSFFDRQLFLKEVKI